MKYIIKDWASNALQRTGKFNFSAYGSDYGSPMIFRDFDSGWEYICENFPEEDHEDFFVEPIQD